MLDNKLLLLIQDPNKLEDKLNSSLNKLDRPSPKLSFLEQSLKKAEPKWYAVEFSYADPAGNESNYLATEWIRCFKLKGNNELIAKQILVFESFETRETLEDNIVVFYCHRYLQENSIRLNINQFFLFYAFGLDNEDFGLPFYHGKYDYKDSYIVNPTANIFINKALKHYTKN